jgi:hypothetical protein
MAHDDVDRLALLARASGKASVRLFAAVGTEGVSDFLDIWPTSRGVRCSVFGVGDRRDSHDSRSRGRALKL